MFVSVLATELKTVEYLEITVAENITNEFEFREGGKFPIKA